jgi:hypothetical protein
MEKPTDREIHDILADSRKIAVIWSAEDVRTVHPHLSAEQAWQVLQEVERRHGRDLGINWATLRAAADELFAWPQQVLSPSRIAAELSGRELPGQERGRGR